MIKLWSINSILNNIPYYLICNQGYSVGCETVHTNKILQIATNSMKANPLKTSAHK